MDSSSSTARSFSVLPVDVSGDHWNSTADANADLRRKSKKKKRKKKVSDLPTTKFNSSGNINMEFKEIESEELEISRLILSSKVLVEAKEEARERCSVHIPNLSNRESTEYPGILEVGRSHMPNFSNQEWMDWKKAMVDYPGLLEEGRSHKIDNSPSEKLQVTIFNLKGIENSEFPAMEPEESKISRLTLSSSAELRQRSIKAGNGRTELVELEADAREKSVVHNPNLSNEDSMDWGNAIEYPGSLEEGRSPAILNSPPEEPPPVTIFNSNRIGNSEFPAMELEEPEILSLILTSSAELRQRSVKVGNGGNVLVEAQAEKRNNSVIHIPNLSNQGSMDWDKVMAQYPGVLEDVTSFRNSPLNYVLAEINGGSTLRTSISAGIERKRQRVYNTMFHVPLRCERLIDVGFFVCLDIFLSLLTIMPARIVMIVWRFLKTRQFQMPNDRELSDFCCFVILVFGVSALQLTDISLIYHIIRGQGTVKLYVVYNVLEIFDNLLRSFGEDVLQVLFNSIEELASCSPENITFDLMRYILDQIIAIIIFTLHSFVLLAEAITLSTCVISHNNALLALLVSNNFAEIKSNVFKRVSRDNIHSLVCHDIIERFHISAFVLFILTQNILESESPWFGGFLSNVMLVYMCEVLIDTIKHSFLAKFNEIKPATYSEFLEDLCKQILNIESEDSKKTLIFIPLAPACVVIRVLTPLYATLLPFGPLPWRLSCIITYSILSYFILFICKIVVGRSLSFLASWYLQRHSNRKPHVD